MANDDVYYGSDAEVRIGFRADRDTPPEDWFNVEFNTFGVNKQTNKVQRPRLGAARQNRLDPLRPREGIQRFNWSTVIDGDLLMLALWLRAALGAPTTTGSGPYTHTWASGDRTERYFDIAIRRGSEKVTWVQACSLGAVSSDFGGDNSQDFDITLSGMARNRTRPADWPAGDVVTVPTPAPAIRAQFLIDGTAVDQVPNGGWTWDRNLQGDFYAAKDAAGDKLVNYLRPGPAPTHSGRVTYRAHGSDFEDIADVGTEFAAEIRYLGVTAGHSIRFAHPQANMNDIPDDTGVGVFERSLSWSGHQDASDPALRITIVNAVTSYA
mgnify:CR=1 FL=1